MIVAVFKCLIQLTDTNECEDDNGGCDHTCINIGGSYQCACNDGYKLNSDFHSCIGKILYYSHSYL